MAERRGGTSSPAQLNHVFINTYWGWTYLDRAPLTKHTYSRRPQWIHAAVNLRNQDVTMVQIDDIRRQSCYIVICDMSGCTIFFHIVINGIIFWKNYWTWDVFWFSLQHLCETFLILRRLQRDVIMNVHMTEFWRQEQTGKFDCICMSGYWDDGVIVISPSCWQSSRSTVHDDSRLKKCNVYGQETALAAFWHGIRFEFSVMTHIFRHYPCAGVYTENTLWALLSICGLSPYSRH
jgi:hypothetical protein